MSFFLFFSIKLKALHTHTVFEGSRLGFLFLYSALIFGGNFVWYDTGILIFRLRFQSLFILGPRSDGRAALKIFLLRVPCWEIRH